MVKKMYVLTAMKRNDLENEQSAVTQDRVDLDLAD